ncbi:MAG: hypothetical protein IJ255_01610 [Bacteroidales bacterium]|nr:hypothetical protein [Bacteroidales bacterium]
MKKITLFVFTAIMMVLGTNVASAQGKYGADSAECIKYLSYYKEYYKQKNYDSALPNWRQAYKLCPPTANQNMLIDGTTMIRQLINKNAKNTEYRKALIDTLMTLHDVRAEYYPNYAVTSRNNKGTDMNNFIKDDNSSLYKGLNEIIALNQEETKASILLFNLNTAIALYQEGELDAEQVINTYQRNINLVNSATPANDSEKEANDRARADMEGLFITSKVASCDNLIALFTPRYEANPNDLDLATNIVKMMNSTDDCTNNDLFLRAATTMHKIQPSAQSAYFLFRLNAAKENNEEAAAYMEEAINGEGLDAATAAKYNYEYASFCIRNNMGSKAVAAANKAASLDESYAGKSYQIIANAWAQASCGGDEIQRRAKYWVATDYMQRAMNADESLADDCRKAIGMYSAYYPNTADAFMYDLTNGQSYTVSCGGMSATTTVRTNK